jgi:hypothetical protein
MLQIVLEALAFFNELALALLDDADLTIFLLNLVFNNLALFIDWKWSCLINAVKILV